MEDELSVVKDEEGGGQTYLGSTAMAERGNTDCTV